MCNLVLFIGQVFSISDAMHRDLPEMRHFGGIQILSIFSKIDQYPSIMSNYSFPAQSVGRPKKPKKIMLRVASIL